jgi:hypothetical protein
MTTTADGSPVWHVSATSTPEALADWLELQALFDPGKSSSMEDLVGLLRSTGMVEEATSADDPFDRGSEASQEIAESALEAVSTRLNSCNGGYPFKVTSQSLTLKRGGASSVYSFLLLLSTYGKDAGGREDSGASLFELVAGNALKEYLGSGVNGARVFQFGFPRRLTPAQFPAALDKLCTELKEGGGTRNRPTLGHQKDAHLDIVAWIPMPDGRLGKVIAFGQCATGWNWQEKETELQADKWCEHWMLDAPPVDPVRALLMPHAAIGGDWALHTRYGGILFDRCRISAFSRTLNAAIKRRIAAWNSRVFAEEQAP